MKDLLKRIGKTILKYIENVIEHIKTRRAKILEDSNLRLKLIENLWQNFLEEETYLIYDFKQQIKNTICKKNLPIQLPFYLLIDFSLKNKIKKNQEEIHQYIHRVDSYNHDFVAERLETFKDFFDGKEGGIKNSLDKQQRLAIIRDDKHNLVVAGAGSGKTTILLARIIYLLRRKDNVPKEKILALAFGKEATNEMTNKLREDYKTTIEISTFHKLGYKAIAQKTGKKPNCIDRNEAKIIIEEAFKKLLEKKPFQQQVMKYISYYQEEETKETSFKDQEEYYIYMKNRRYTTLKGESVKSVGEKNIANWLFLNQVDYEYEATAEWAGQGYNYGVYQPDFYLPKLDVYMEHWGLTKQNTVPKWFTRPNETHEEATQRYLQSKEWKLTQFQKHKKKLVESYDYSKRTVNYFYHLKNKIKEANPKAEFKTLPYKEFIKKVFEYKENKESLKTLSKRFIETAKSNKIDLKEIEHRIKNKQYDYKQKSFAKIAVKIYEEYNDYLHRKKKIDFYDMIDHSIKIIKSQPEIYHNKYDYILVDEYQDISKLRIELLKCFVNPHSKTKLFCVGDDWQSIYSFTGSLVKLFTRFEEEFPSPEITKLNYNHRSCQSIVEMSNHLIKHNKNRIDKPVKSTKFQQHKAEYIIIDDEKYKTQIQERERLAILYKIKNLIKSGETDIMVISRFRRQLLNLRTLCENHLGEKKCKQIKFYTVHGSKGTQAKHVIIMGLTSGLYGFPSEIEDPIVLEMAKHNIEEEKFEEERRLLYVAITRSEEFLYIYTTKNSPSIFIKEIKNFLDKPKIIGFVEGLIEELSYVNQSKIQDF